MLRQKIGTTLLVCGALMLMLSISAWRSPHVASAMPALQPSPRPTLEPTPGPDTTPREPGPAESLPGRVTGTVIDVTTGAPAPGIRVNVGGVLVTTDQNGNYDRWIIPGTYAVQLALAPGQGMAAQDVQLVELGSEATVVLHLSFRSPAANIQSPPTQPPISQPPDAPPAAPSAAPAPDAPTLPDGGISHLPGVPTRLPHTGSESPSPWGWVSLAMLLMLAGLVLNMRMRARGAGIGTMAIGSRADRTGSRAERSSQPAASSEQLLAALLNVEDRRARSAARAEDESDELLANLLKNKR